MAKYRKLGRTSDQRKALIRNQVTALLYNGKIVTTEAKAKEVRKVAEGLIALALKEKDNFEEVTVTAKVPRKDAEGKRVKEVVDGKKVTVYDEVEKTIKKDMPSRLHARRQMLKVLYPVKEVPTEGAKRKKNTKQVDLCDKLFTEIAPKYADTLSRKDPAYVGRAKEVQVAEKAIQEGNCPAEALPELKPVFAAIHTQYPDIDKTNVGVGSTIFAVKPGDGSAREQAASCQKVLGGWANIANEYATKRYRSNLINWGMLPFLIPEGDLPFTNGDYIFVPEIRKAVEEKADVIKAYVVKDGALVPFEMTLGALTDDEREIIRKGCLINYYRG